MGAAASIKAAVADYDDGTRARGRAIAKQRDLFRAAVARDPDHAEPLMMMASEDTQTSVLRLSLRFTQTVNNAIKKAQTIEQLASMIKEGRLILAPQINDCINAFREWFERPPSAPAATDAQQQQQQQHDDASSSHSSANSSSASAVPSAHVSGSQLRRIRLRALIVVALGHVHQYEKLEQLLGGDEAEAGNDCVRAFDRMLRFYFVPRECTVVVKCGAAQMLYGWQPIPPLQAERIARTPFVRGAFAKALDAMQGNGTMLLTGPAASGKKAIVVDLAHDLGYEARVIDAAACTESFDALQSYVDDRDPGCVLIFDRVNRTTLIKPYLEAALRARPGEGSVLQAFCCDPSDPGGPFGGNLKFGSKAACGVTSGLADRQLLVEALLAAEGFEDYADLAASVVAFLASLETALASTMITAASSYYYDFASPHHVRHVCGLAGRRMRSEVELSDAEAVAAGLRSIIAVQFAREDEEKTDPKLAELFRGTTAAEPQDEEEDPLLQDEAELGEGGGRGAGAGAGAGAGVVAAASSSSGGDGGISSSGSSSSALFSDLPEALRARNALPEGILLAVQEAAPHAEFMQNRLGAVFNGISTAYRGFCLICGDGGPSSSAAAGPSRDDLKQALVTASGRLNVATSSIKEAHSADREKLRAAVEKTVVVPAAAEEKKSVGNNTKGGGRGGGGKGRSRPPPPPPPDHTFIIHACSSGVEAAYMEALNSAFDGSGLVSSEDEDKPAVPLPSNVSIVFIIDAPTAQALPSSTRARLGVVSFLEYL